MKIFLAERTDEERGCRATLRFLIEQVRQVKEVYPGEEKLSKDFLAHRAAMP